MIQHLMPGEVAVDLLDKLLDHGVDPCVGGGWAVDALVGRQTREHSDLGLWVMAHHLEPLFVAFSAVGLDRVFPWPGDRPWNFVLHDGAHLRVDLHLYEPISADSWQYGSAVAGFPTEALDGREAISGRAVRCDAPEWALRRHTGYPPRDVDRHHMPLQCDAFGLQFPEPY